MKNVLFGSGDPGSANLIAAVIRRLDANHPYTLVTDCKGYQVPNLQKSYTIISDGIDIQSVFNDSKPDLVFTGTSIHSEAEQLIREEARRRNIFSIAAIDHWTRLQERFIGSNGAVFPDLIFVPDSTAIEQAIACGIPASLLKEFGQPHFYDCGQFKSKFSKEGILSKLSISNNWPLVVFLSDALSETEGSESKAISHYGFSELKILDALIEEIERSNLELNLVVKLHPREGLDKFKTKKYPAFVSFWKDFSLWDLLTHADFVIGMFSASVLEAAALGHRPLRIEINAKNMDLLPVPEKYFFHRVLNRADLGTSLRKYLKSSKQSELEKLFLDRFSSQIIDLFK